jgi:hypothetical protein
MDLDWCEGGSLYMAYRLLHHLPIYVRPGDVFAPFPYPPAHSLVLALAGRVTGGIDYAVGRLVSIGFFAAMCGVLYGEVRRQFADVIDGAAAGIATIGLIASAFPATGGWYDLVRVDSMMLACSVIGASLVSAPDPGLVRILGAAVALTVAIYTKQTAAFFVAWICLFTALRRWRDGWRLTLTVLVLCSACLAALQAETRGHFWFWIFGNLLSHPVHPHELVHALRIVFRFAPFSPALPLVAAALAWAQRLTSRSLLWCGMLAAALPTALLPFAKDGGWLNDLIPIVVLIAVVTISLAADLLRRQQAWTGVVRFAMAASFIAFLFVRPVSVSASVPDAIARNRAENLNRFVAGLHGGVLMPQLAFTPARNGQTNPHWHRMGHADLEWSGRPLEENWVVTRSQARYALLNWADRGALAQAVRARYHLAGGVPDDARVHMLTGGGQVDLDQLWELPSQAGDPPPGYKPWRAAE